MHLRIAALVMVMATMFCLFVFANMQKRDVAPPPLKIPYEVISRSTGANLNVGWNGYGWPMTAYSRHRAYPISSWNPWRALVDLSIVAAAVGCSIVAAVMMAGAKASG